MTTCPCCNGAGEIAEIKSLTRMQRQLFDAVASLPRTSIELADVLYGDRADGGPENASRVIWAMVSEINRKIAPMGIKLRAGSHRAGSEPYRIIRI